MPVSVTAMRISLSVVVSRTVIFPCSPVYLIALVTRLVTTLGQTGRVDFQFDRLVDRDKSEIQFLLFHSARRGSSVARVHSFISVSSRVSRSLLFITAERSSNSSIIPGKRAGVAVDDADIFELRGVETGVGAEQMGTGDDRSERSAQFVAQRGKEFILEACSLAELLVFVLQLAGLFGDTTFEAGVGVAQGFLLGERRSFLSSSSL